MKNIQKNKILISFIVCVIVLFLMSFNFLPTGYVGTTRKGGGDFGCLCHGSSPATGVSVTFNGPDSVAAGQTVTYQVKISHGPAISGGFNVASGSGIIAVLPGDTTVRRQDGELTHTHPKLFVSDTVSWSFSYTAPITPMIDTLFATGNSTNNDNKSFGDEWNWSSNYQVSVYNPIGIINISSLAREFSLSQNYPNPFNPVTHIKFSVANSSEVKIVIYDILGNSVATLVNGSMKQGEYWVDFDGSSLSSGTYFYSLIVNGENISTKRMLMVK
jgi:hypothetical protein